MKHLRPLLLVAAVLGLARAISGINHLVPRPVYAESDHQDHQDPEGEVNGHGDEHEEHEEGVVHLNAHKLAGLNLSTVKVRRGSLAQTLDLTGEVRWNAERVTHVVPPVPGVVREVNKSLGDSVDEGEVLAILDSRELAAAKAAYLTALAREQLSLTNFAREEKLRKQNISSERDYLESQSALAQAGIESRLTRLQLHAIGLSHAEIQAIPGAADDELARCRMTAPFAGVVLERHISRGEMLTGDTEAFMIIDPSEVWVIGRAYERDLRLLRTGQQAVVRLEAIPGELFEGKVDYIGGRLDPKTRTVEVRVVLPNPGCRFRAGMFCLVSITSSDAPGEAQQPLGLLVPRGAMQAAEGGFVVFRRLDEPGEFRMVPVRVRGRSKETVWVEGELRAGDEVAIGDTFVLKSEAAKEEMGGGHSH